MLTILFLTACTSHGRYTMLVPTHTSKSPDCDVDVFQAGYPSREFVKIARIDVHIERTYYLRSNLKDVLPELRKQACETGADAIVEIEERSSKMNLSETHIYHVTATGIKYQQTGANQP